jgi:hypothetical protein
MRSRAVHIELTGRAGGVGDKLSGGAQGGMLEGNGALFYSPPIATFL